MPQPQALLVKQQEEVDLEKFNQGLIAFFAAEVAEVVHTFAEAMVHVQTNFCCQ